MPIQKKASSGNTQILEKLDALDKKFNTLNDALIGTAESDKPGLMERVRKLEEWVTNEKKLIYLIVSGLVIDIVSRLWTLIVK